MTIRVTVSGGRGSLYDELLGSLSGDVEKEKVATDIYAESVLRAAVDTGDLRNSITLTLGETPTIDFPLDYSYTIMEGGHSDQTPPGTLTAIIDRHTRS